MTQLLFDTLGYYKKLINAGMEEKQARVMVELLKDIATFIKPENKKDKVKWYDNYKI